MEIDWPIIAQGSGTGTSYTSSDGYTWIWSGSVWNGSFGNSLGGFLAPWVIFSTTGIPTAYRTLTLAMNAALSGQTIHLYGNAIEESAEIILKDKVDINFNGNTYTLSNASDNYFTTFSNPTGTISCKMYNGIVNRTSGGFFTKVIDSQVVTSSFEFIGMKFRNATGGICGYFRGSVKGGEFYSVGFSGIMFEPGLLAGNLSADITIQDVYGEALSGGSGIYISDSNSYPTEYTFINLVGVCDSLPIYAGRTGIDCDTTLGIYNLIDCIGFSNNPEGVGIQCESQSTSNVISINRCYGISLGDGIVSRNTNLHNCVAEGSLFTGIAPFPEETKSSFRSLNNSYYYGCADSQPENTGISLRIASGYDCDVENCAFSGYLGILSVSSSNNNLQSTVNIKNSTIRSAEPIYFNFGSSAIYNIENNVIKSASSNSIVLTGATGGRIINNTISTSFSGTNKVIAAATLTTGKPQYQAGNVSINCFFDYTTTGQPQLITAVSSNKGNLFY